MLLATNYTVNSTIIGTLHDNLQNTEFKFWGQPLFCLPTNQEQKLGASKITKHGEQSSTLLVRNIRTFACWIKTISLPIFQNCSITKNIYIRDIMQCDVVCQLWLHTEVTQAALFWFSASKLLQRQTISPFSEVNQSIMLIINLI